MPPKNERRPKHPDKDLEKVLRDGEKQGWIVNKRGRYFKMYCPCGIHIKTVHITPHKNYKQNLLSQLRSQTCWEDEK